MVKKSVLLAVWLMAGASVAMGSVIASDDCSSLDGFTSSNPTETTIVAAGGPDGSDCVQFLSRVGKYGITWDLPQAIDMSSNVSGSEMSFSFDYSALSTYTEDTVFTAYAIVDGVTYPIWTTSNLTADYTAGWDTWTGYLASNVTYGGLIDSGTMTGVMFYVSAGSRFLKLDNLAISQVPEPATLALFALGGLVGLLRKRK